MSRACKCDRCGAYYDPYIREIPNNICRENITINSISLLRNENRAHMRTFELCPVCMDYILSQLMMAPVSDKPVVTNGDIYRDMEKEYPYMHADDWRPEGAMKIRVWCGKECYIYDYQTKKLYEDNTNE